MIDQQVAARVIDEALKGGGDFAEIFAESRVATAIGLEDRLVDRISSGQERGAGIRVVSGETTGFAHTTDLSESSLLQAARVAGAAAKSKTDSVVKVALNPLSTHTTPAQQFPGEISKTQKVELLQRSDEAARLANDSIKQVSASYGDSRRQVLIANSQGVFVSDNQLRTRFAVMCIADGDTGMQTGFESIGATVGFELFEQQSVEALATKAAEVALAKLKARPAPSGEWPVVLKAGGGGVLFHEACGHGLEADHIKKNASAFVGKLGTQVATPLVTLVDDGTMGGQWGAYGFDDEGTPAQRNVLIQDGVLTDYMWDWLRTKDGSHSISGNGRRENYECLPMVRMTNTVLTNGSDDPQEIIRQTPRGIYVASLGGGQVNTANGDFVFGMTEAYLIENGEITEPIRDANLIGNGPEILMRIDALGNDMEMGPPGTCGKQGQGVPVGVGQPTLRVSSITIGGTAQ